MVYFGFISKCDPVKGLYKVRFEEDKFESHWIFAIESNTKDNKSESGFDEGEHVACVMDKHREHGVILGAIYDDGNLPEVGNKDIWVKKFKDGSFIHYNRADKKLRLSIEGEVEVVKSTKFKITASDVIELNGNSNNGILKAQAVLNRLNAYESDLNKLRSIAATLAGLAVSAPTTPVTNATLAALFNAVSYPVTPLAVTVLNDVINAKVKH